MRTPRSASCQSTLKLSFGSSLAGLVVGFVAGCVFVALHHLLHSADGLVVLLPPPRHKPRALALELIAPVRHPADRRVMGNSCRFPEQLTRSIELPRAQRLHRFRLQIVNARKLLVRLALSSLDLVRLGMRRRMPRRISRNPHTPH